MTRRERVELAVQGFAVFVGIAFLVVAIAGMAYLIDLGEKQAQATVVAAQSRAEIKAITKHLLECNVPPEERNETASVKPGEDDCYVRNANRTARAVGEISDISVVAAACGAANPGDVPATRLCVEEALTPTGGGD